MADDEQGWVGGAGRLFGYPSRLDDEGRQNYAAYLLQQLAQLERDTHPSCGSVTASEKDTLAFLALETAGHLVQAVAGWAIDHQYGMAMRGLSFVPGQPSGTKLHPEYLEQKRAVDDHRHEKEGAALRYADVVDPLVARTLLRELLRANPGAFPFAIQLMSMEALKALELGEVFPIFEPNGRNRKRGYRELNLQLRAIGFVEYRAGFGMTKFRAQEIVAEKYGVEFETVKGWERRLKESLGGLEVARTVSFARNAASHFGRNDGIAFAEYSDAALEACGNEYKQRLGRTDDE